MTHWFPSDVILNTAPDSNTMGFSRDSPVTTNSSRDVMRTGFLNEEQPCGSKLISCTLYRHRYTPKLSIRFGGDDISTPIQCFQFELLQSLSST